MNVWGSGALKVPPEQGKWAENARIKAAIDAYTGYFSNQDRKRTFTIEWKRENHRCLEDFIIRSIVQRFLKWYACKI